MEKNSTSRNHVTMKVYLPAPRAMIQWYILGCHPSDRGCVHLKRCETKELLLKLSISAGRRKRGKGKGGKVFVQFLSHISKHSHVNMASFRKQTFV